MFKYVLFLFYCCCFVFLIYDTYSKQAGQLLHMHALWRAFVHYTQLPARVVFLFFLFFF